MESSERRESCEGSLLELVPPAWQSEHGQGDASHQISFDPSLATALDLPIDLAPALTWILCACRLTGRWPEALDGVTGNDTARDAARRLTSLQPDAIRSQELLGPEVRWIGHAESAIEQRDALLQIRELGGNDFELSGPGGRLSHAGLLAIRSAWQSLSGAVAGDPDLKISSLPLVGSEAVSGTISEFAAGKWDHRGGLSIAGRFAEIAAAHPDRPAVSWQGGEISYAELHRSALAIAVQLQDRGVTAGEMVGIVPGRDPAMMAGLLGILYAGAAYVPLDTKLPSSRLDFIVGDTSLRFALVPAGVSAALPPGLVRIDTDAAGISGSARESAAGLQIASSSGDQLAYVMYTSGSTGTPKGVLVTHGGVVRLVISPQYVDLDERSRVLHAAPLGFDASTFEIWGPLLNGGCCVIHDEPVPTGAGLAQVITSRRVDTAWLTSSLFNAVVDEDPSHLRGLDQLLIGGEALSVAHVRKALKALPGLSLINGYGPTECTTFTCTHPIRMEDLDGPGIPIGRPISATSLHVLGADLQVLPHGLVGELYVGGLGVALGYLNQPELTASRFIDNPFDGGATKLYRTGDLVCWRPDGCLHYVGRSDTQIKISGYRIEPGEIEAALNAHPDVVTAVVVALDRPPLGKRLVAYFVPGQKPPSVEVLRDFMAARLPDYMVPARFVPIDRVPVTRNGKLDRGALPDPGTGRPDSLGTAYAAPQDATERGLAEAFSTVLGVDRIGRMDSFFELGGNSLLAIRLVAAVRKAGLGDLPIAAVFGDPTVAGLARRLSGSDAAVDPRRLGRLPASGSTEREPIAIVGMAGRFPGAKDIEAFWNILAEGRDTIRHFGEGELDASIPKELRGDPLYVPARGVVDGVDMFDAAFFGISTREAELLDPQHRLFLELCWECLERAGHVPEKYPAPIGVFGGMYNATYFQKHVSAHPDKVDQLGEFQAMLANEKDYVANRVAYRLNLTGPAVSVYSACSTSLVAIAQAVTSLRAGQCGMALAGGSSITCPPGSGYLYQEGAMLSPDGRTRTFDADAKGTVFSDGVAVVLLKRLSDALADGNTIHAVIRGVAVNNDGAAKASFTAPGVDGQAAVVASALDDAGVEARSISYVEAHGTATPLGDPVEIAALTKAFRRQTGDTGYCGIGSVKSNMGHLVIAAGATGVIKTALALERELLPGTVHFRSPNPHIDFAHSPFRVVATPEPWRRGETPRRAGVSSFGVGGTNAHVVLEEAPPAAAPVADSGLTELRLSARSEAALEAATAALADHLEANAGLGLADVAYTLEQGRRDFQCRVAVVAANRDAAIASLRDRQALARRRRRAVASPSIVLTFPGQGSQYPGMGSMLHVHDAAFREAVDECAAALPDMDLREVMFRGSEDQLAQTRYTQPATFCIEYALARSWLAAGIRPDLMIGHSIGEFVAATLAGVMSIGDALRLVAHRGALMQALPPGSMLSVRAGAQAIAPLLPPALQLAAENAPSTCVVAGADADVDAFAALLATKEIVARKLRTSHAFHSAMMDPAVVAFESAVRGIRLAPPAQKIISTATGTLLSAAEATNPSYWASHLRHTVRFSTAVGEALAEGRVFLEAGPRSALTSLVRLHATRGQAPAAVASLADSPESELEAIAGARADLWSCGVTLPSLSSPAGRRRRVLPTYPFERKRLWLEPLPSAPPARPAGFQPTVEPNMPAQENTIMASAPPDRKPTLSAKVRELLEEVSGIEIGADACAAGFVEQGLDSLTLTQVAMQLRKTFGLNVTFRNLMEDFRSVDELVAHLDATLPQEAAPAAQVAAPASIAAMPQAAPLAALPVAAGSADSSFVQQVIQQQMQLMAQQLAVLRGAAMPAPAAVPAVAAPAPQAQRPSTPAPAAAPEDTAPDGMQKYDVKKAFGAIARIHTSATSLTDRQQARLERFMARYIARTGKSKAYTIEHRPHLADPRVVNGFRPQIKEIIYQIVIERSKGSRVWDLDGNEYIDALNGFGMNMFGWQPEFVVEAVRAQIDSGYDIGPQHPLAGEVAKLFCEVTGNDRAAFCNTGSEAVMGCVRVARTVTGRSKIAIFTGAYHGIFDEVIVRGTKKLRSVPAAPGIMPNTAENVLVLDYGTPESLEILRQQAGELAAILVEPVQSRRPDFQPREFLQKLRELTQETGSLLIFDEVVTGFRSHPGGIQALFGIRADLCSYGKVVGGGFPIGVISGKRAFMDALDGGQWQYGDQSIPTVGVTYFAGTFVRHPLALVAARAVLEHIREQGPALQEKLTANTAAMVAEMNAYCRSVGAPVEVKSFASVWKVFFNEDHPLQDLLFAMMRNRGIHILDNFPCFFTTAHSAADISKITEAFREAVAELQESEFLPRAVIDRDKVVDLTQPPVPGARLGRDGQGKPAWFVPKPGEPGKYLKVGK